MLSLSALHQSLFGFTNHRVEDEYVLRLDTLSWRWLAQWLAMATAAGIAQIVCANHFDHDDDFCRLKSMIHLVVCSSTLIYGLFIRNMEKPILNAKQLVVLALTLERAYHILFLIGLVAWTPLAAKL